MNVELIAKTETVWNPRKLPGKALDSKFEERNWQDSWSDYHGVKHGQEIIEFAGRLCYESFHLPNEKTYEQSGYVRNIVSLGHFSVLEHVSVSFYVDGVSRNLSHELIRHRHLSFSEISQRYVDVRDANFIIPPAIYDAFEGDERPASRAEPLAGTEFADYYEMSYNGLMSDGVKGKKAREAARAYMPGGTETKFVVTGNLRAWRDVLGKRRSPQADAEMQLFAEEVYAILAKHYPDVFADVE